MAVAKILKQIDSTWANLIRFEQNTVNIFHLHKNLKSLIVRPEFVAGPKISAIVLRSCCSSPS